MYQIAAVIAAGTLLVLVVVLVRRGALREELALVWLLATAVLIAMAIVPALLGSAAAWIDVADPTNLLFGAAMYGLALLALLQQVQISRIRDRERKLAQEIAILRLETAPATE